MNTDKIYSVLVTLELEIGNLRNVYWQYRAGLKTDEDLIIAYNEFRAHTGCVCKGED